MGQYSYNQRLSIAREYNDAIAKNGDSSGAYQRFIGAYIGIDPSTLLQDADVLELEGRSIVALQLKSTAAAIHQVLLSGFLVKNKG